MPIPLRVVSEQQHQMVECTECGKCCTYVALEIDPPTRPRFVTEILWYLYHDKVSIYVDGTNEWCVQFETRCRNLDDDLLCKIYAERPHICRSFDNETCEVNGQEGETFTFRTPEEFLDYLKRERPRVYERVAKKFIPPGLKPGARPRAPKISAR